MAKTKLRNKIEQTQKTTVLESVKNVTAPSVIKDIGELQVSIQNTLAKLSADITNKIEQMNNVEEAIGIKSSQLKELYDIDAKAISFSDMVARYEAEEASLREKIKEAEIDWLTQKNERDKQWKRDYDDHVYMVNIQQRKTKDELEAEIAKLKRDEAIRQDNLMKSWQQREDELIKQEDEFASLQDAVANFDAKLKAEIAKAEAIVGNTMKKNYEHQIELMRKDMEVEKTVSTSRVAQLNDVIVGLNNQIKELSVQLTAARNDAKEVTAQALKSASGREVADVLQKVVDSREVTASNKK